MNDPGKSDKPIVAMEGPGPSETPANQPEGKVTPETADYFAFWSRRRERSSSEGAWPRRLGRATCLLRTNQQTSPIGHRAK